MFAKLFAESGLSLDRLRALLEVNAAGSIVKAAGGDPVRQSQFSRQIKELEDFFRVKLLERHGKGIRLTANGRELVRISRFFLLGLTNFRRGCLAEEQTFHFGASATALEHFILPALAVADIGKSSPRFVTEVVADDEIAARLNDLTLDFGILTTPADSRLLQTKALGQWKYVLWVPRAICAGERQARAAFHAAQLPLAIASEVPSPVSATEYRPRLICSSFVEAHRVLQSGSLATVLPDFMQPENASAFLRLAVPGLGARSLKYHLAWNPRLLRLNPHAARVRDALMVALGRNRRMIRSD